MKAREEDQRRRSGIERGRRKALLRAPVSAEEFSEEQRAAHIGHNRQQAEEEGKRQAGKSLRRIQKLQDVNDERRMGKDFPMARAAGGIQQVNAIVIERHGAFGLDFSGIALKEEYVISTHGRE